MGIGCTTTSSKTSGISPHQYNEFDAELIFNEAIKNYRANRLKMAIRDFDAIVSSYPNSKKSSEALYLSCEASFRIEEYRAAVRKGEQLIKNYPQSSWIGKTYLLLSQIYQSQEDYATSASYLLEGAKYITDEVTRDDANILLTELIINHLNQNELNQLTHQYPTSPATPYLLYTIAERHVENEEYSHARITLYNLIKDYPSSSYAPLAKRLYNQLRPGTYPDQIETPPSSTNLQKPSNLQNSLDHLPPIGVVCPLTGRYAIHGKSVHAGIKLAAEQFQTQTEHQLQLIIKDSMGDPDQAIQVVQELIGTEGVKVIIGPIMSGPTIVAADIAESQKIPLISPTATDERITKIGSYIFRLNASSGSQGHEMADYAFNQLGYRTFGLLHSTNTGAVGLAQSFADRINQLGGIVVSEQQYMEGTTDFRDQLTTLKDAEPEAIYIPATPNEVVLIAPQLAYYKVESQILGADGWNHESVVRLGEHYVEGSIFTAQFFGAVSSKSSVNFRNAFRYEYGHDPDRTAALGFDAMNLVLECLKSGYQTPAMIRNCLNQTSDYQGASGRITFSYMGEARRDVVFLTIVDGHIMEVKD